MRRWSRSLSTLTGLGLAAAAVQVFPADAAAPSPAATAAALAAAQAGQGAAGSATPAELHQLDLFLGTWSCVATISFPGTPTTVNNLTSRVYPVLGGHWYEFDGFEQPTAADPHGSASRWVFGWDAADGGFTALYYDDQETSGSETSPGWADGHLTFSGPYVISGYHLENRDDFTSTDRDHYTDHFYAQLDGTWVPVGQSVCHRV